jgi:hypothetical protein
MGKKFDRGYRLADRRRQSHKAPSVFRPEALLREARRQKQLPLIVVPEICVVDPNGDVVRQIKTKRSAAFMKPRRRSRSASEKSIS